MGMAEGKGARPRGSRPRSEAAPALASACIAVAAALALWLQSTGPTSIEARKAAFRDAAGMVEPSALASASVYSSSEFYSFVEWAGLGPVKMDCRPEIWEPAISGLDENLHREYADTMERDDWEGPTDATEGAFKSYLEGNGIEYVVWYTDYAGWMRARPYLEEVGANDQVAVFRVERGKL